MEPLERFTRLVVEPAPPLDEGAFLIAAGADPSLDVDAQMARLDELAAGCHEPTLEGVVQYLFDDLGFAGNEAEYDDPANSYLDHVLDRRLGIPITLSVLTIEVGRRLGVALGGVGMPGHYLVRSLHDPAAFVDAFRGAVIDEARCRALYSALRAEPWDDSYLDVVDHRTTLWRILTNLRVGFMGRADLADLRWVLAYQATFPDRSPEERRAVAGLLGSVGDLATAARVLDDAAADLPEAAAEKARAQARVLRARMN